MPGGETAKACGACARVCGRALWSVCSFLSINMTGDEAVNEDFSRLINNYQGRGQSRRQRSVSRGRQKLRRGNE